MVLVTSTSHDNVQEILRIIDFLELYRFGDNPSPVRQMGKVAQPNQDFAALPGLVAGATQTVDAFGG